ncbi:hypothetical protein DVH05_006616 [Phytophthora capsici]|nr:hypothetical protein DVH05_006616 [Phytophthora capsici]
MPKHVENAGAHSGGYVGTEAVHGSIKLEKRIAGAITQALNILNLPNITSFSQPIACANDVKVIGCCLCTFPFISKT